MTLWVLFCRVTEKWDTLFTLYAKACEDAERQARGILQEHQYERVELREYPHGFRVVMTYLPGRIEEDINTCGYLKPRIGQSHLNFQVPIGRFYG